MKALGAYGLVLAGFLLLIGVRLWLESSSEGIYNTEPVGVRWAIIGVSLVILGYFGRTLANQKRWWGWVGSILLVGGGLANTFERLFFANVYDYIYYPGLNVYGNMADIWIGVGIGLLLIDYVIEHRQQRSQAA